MKKSKLDQLDSLIREACANKEPYIIQITSLEELYEFAAMSGAGGSITGHAGKTRNKKEQKTVRKEVQTEMMLRKYIREKVKSIFKENRKKDFLNERALRLAIRSILKEGDVSDVHPHRSTGINVLEDLLKKIIPILEDDFKVLTTSEQQRESFRSHVIHGVRNALAPVQASEKAGEADAEEPAEDAGLSEDVDINIEDEDEEGKFIDIDDKKPEAEEEPADPRDEFGIDGEDETGRNAAYNSFKKIQSQIVDAYSLLGDEKDQGIFYDYLITNLKLYFDKFETELQTRLNEPTTPEYEKQAGELDEPADPAGDDLDLDQPAL